VNKTANRGEKPIYCYIDEHNAAELSQYWQSCTTSTD